MDIIQEAKSLINLDKNGLNSLEIRMVQALSLLVDRLEWRPIESAPKSPVHKFSEAHWAAPNVLCCNYRNAGQRAALSINHLSTLDGGKNWDWAFSHPCEYTHWMHLPLPPVGDK